ncbi:MAG TPA: 16S rRNA (guanine(966)-N(2))-methyltransferase RsmD [Blastocatellia bacterium]|nr:16S rRNA (guanine(966)-N(2))-methyltransferase RsmD [Blastocatellia bacterium]
MIGGKYRGRRLRTSAGLDVRPTSDRLRETLFNILAPRVRGSRFLDICAGSGAVGIEALSRGAAHATFIERARPACSVIRENLDAFASEDDARIINRDAAQAVSRLREEGESFDIAFLDPPYASGLYSQVMEKLSEGGLVSGDGVVVVEHRSKTPPREAYGRLRVYREVRQGESALAFYSFQVEDEAPL